ncbi:MAG: FKBP-type peptidyl-prolyl cis-trans isomerase [Acidobacteriota bacterium]|nr:FKBP-type peptidyl-prolyl cis-trans isomerase [Acidobacteriota bacterium]
MNVLLLMLTVFLFHEHQSHGPDLDDPEFMNKVSYILGWQLGDGAKQQGVDLLSIDHVMDGLSDGLAGKGKYDQNELRKIMTDFQTKLRARATEMRNRKATKNAAIAKEFLEKNKSVSGVMTTESGLQYMVMTPGTGEKPADATTRVKVHYKGTLLDGQEFDSSYKRNQPATFALNGVIKGWTEGLQLMQVGAKYKFWIPPELGYGPNPRPGIIQPNSLLVFEVELLEIMSKPGEKKTGHEGHDHN